MNYWRRYCLKSFGDVVYPDAFNVNAIYGDVRVGKVATHIYFTQAGEDPWQWAGMKKGDALNPNNKYGYMDCDNCGHCIDLHAAAPTDPEIVTKTRADIITTIDGWLREKTTMTE